jgi:IS605 OrfB family transposase
MRLTVSIQLLPTPEQAAALRRTLEQANAACDYISQVAWETKTFRQFPIHRLTYGAVRDTFGLAAQLTVRCIGKVADAYKLDRETQRTFQPHGAIPYDERILSYNMAGSEVSIWTLDGRQAIPFVCGERQRALLATQRGETDLAFVRGKWYLFVTCEVETPEPIDVEGALGVDLGVTNIAVDTQRGETDLAFVRGKWYLFVTCEVETPEPIDVEGALGVDLGVTNIAVDTQRGETHSGKAIKQVRYRHRRLRNKLQKKGTLGCKRRLRKLSGQEKRFAKHVNHCLSKRIVAKAERTKRTIVLEDLTHIRTRVRARRSQRATLHSWAFAQLQAFLVYKATLKGVPVHFVDPRNTSRTCPSCGHIAKANRKTQASFVCTSCGFAGPADVIAARNISGRAVVSRPHCSDADGVGSARAKPKSFRLG